IRFHTRPRFRTPLLLFRSTRIRSRAVLGPERGAKVQNTGPRTARLRIDPIRGLLQWTAPPSRTWLRHYLFVAPCSPRPGLVIITGPFTFQGALNATHPAPPLSGHSDHPRRRC